jgi:hypothetical protein
MKTIIFQPFMPYKLPFFNSKLASKQQHSMNTGLNVTVNSRNVTVGTVGTTSRNSQCITQPGNMLLAVSLNLFRFVKTKANIFPHLLQQIGQYEQWQEGEFRL